ncbi:MAG: sugar 3,4-ketoisomerase [Flavobacteriales bacterium]
MNKLINILELKLLGDERGALAVLEQNIDVPFDIKRVYHIWGTKTGVSRGFHAHRNLKQVAIAVSGSCRFVMDDGVNKEEYLLNSPVEALLIDKMQWHEMHDFSSDCVLLVLASDKYEESDYIRNYDEFLKLVKHDS